MSATLLLLTCLSQLPAPTLPPVCADAIYATEGDPRYSGIFAALSSPEAAVHMRRMLEAQHRLDEENRS